MTAPPPAAVRRAGVVVAAQGAVLVVVAVVLIVRQLGGMPGQPWLNGYGTAGWFVVMGGAVAAAGWALLAGRRWGRGIAVFAQLLLLPVAWYMTVGSGQWAVGVPVALVAAVVLFLLFSRSTLQWLAQAPAASADNSGPDTR